MMKVCWWHHYKISFSRLEKKTTLIQRDPFFLKPIFLSPTKRSSKWIRSLKSLTRVQSWVEIVHVSSGDDLELCPHKHIQTSLKVLQSKRFLVPWIQDIALQLILKLQERESIEVTIEQLLQEIHVRVMKENEKWWNKVKDHELDNKPTWWKSWTSSTIPSCRKIDVLLSSDSCGARWESWRKDNSTSEAS